MQGREEALAAFQREAADRQAPQIREVAAKALRTIQHHYQRAQKLACKKRVSDWRREYFPDRASVHFRKDRLRIFGYWHASETPIIGPSQPIWMNRDEHLHT